MSELAIAQTRARQLHVEPTGRSITLPSSPVGRLMYYLGCMRGVLGDCVPAQLTDYANWHSLSYSDRQAVIGVAKEFPPSKIPLFIEVDELPDNSGNEFLRFSSLEETVTALGISGNGAAVMALQRQVEKQQLLEVMAYTPTWARNNYYQPLLEIQQEQQRQQQAITYQPSYQRPTFSDYPRKQKSCYCTLL